MLYVVLRDIASADYSKVMLWVFEDNMRARHFYEAHGFETNEMVKTSFDVTELCYEKNL